MSFLPRLFPIKTLFDKPSTINGTVRVLENKGVKSLVLNGYTQSKSLTKNEKSEGYWDQFVELVQKHNIKPERILILGYGGGTAAYLFGREYPDVYIDAIEIDPIVVEASRVLFDFSKMHLNIFVEDVHDVLAETKITENKYDVIIVDVYEEGIKVPEHIYSDTFLKGLKKLITPNGLLLFNQAFKVNYKSEYREFGLTLHEIFGNVQFLDVQTSNNAIIYVTR